MSTATRQVTVEFAPATVQAIAHVGQVVTLGNAQFTVHSVEGRDYYAFDQDGTTVVDANMTRASWLVEPVALILPAGSKIGEGFGKEVPLWRLQRGVCLTKRYR